MYIFQALGLSCVPYLPKVMPVLFQCMRNCEDGLREFMFQQLTLLVQFVRQHIRKYLTVRSLEPLPLALGPICTTRAPRRSCKLAPLLR